MEDPLRSTFDIVADIIERNCHIPRAAVTPDSDLLADLAIDSLDLLDVVFAIEEACGVVLPVGQWLHAAQMKRARVERYFVVKELCACIDGLRGMSET